MSAVTGAILAGVAVAGASAAASAATAPDAPGAPDYAAASREGVMADISALPLRKMIESAAKLGKSVTYTDPSTGERRTADFTGFGDTDQALAQLDGQIQGSDKLAAAGLALDQKYGSQYIAQRLKELEESDPTGFALRKSMGSAVSDELGHGYKLAPGMRDEVEQATRGAQAARGNILGAAPASAEAMEIGNAGYRLYQQRLANAASFLSGTTPVAQFGQIAGAQQGATPTVMPQVQSGVGVNPSAGATGASFAAQQYGTQAGIYATQVASNPWASFFSQTGGLGTGSAVVGTSQGLDSWFKKGG
ncbi:MAG TPA: hypothetical protein VMF06_06915 [Candidatus Limnocylindria bacterium]|jgi:hypothetical protein|nr:hypothetical protein [Candidatus Limnocylindria bacterium]